MPSLKDVTIKYTSDVAQALQGFNKVRGESNKLDGDLRSRIGGIGSAASAGGLALTAGLTAPIMGLVTAAVASTRSLGHFGEMIEHASAATGMTTDSLQRLRFVAQTMGVDFGSVETQLVMFQRRLMGIDQDSGNASKVMAELGVSVRSSNGEFRSMNDLFPQTLMALQGMENVTQRNTYAQQLFGRSAAQILPIIGLGKQKFQEYMAAAGVMSAKDLADAEEYQRVVNQLEAKLGGMSRKAAVAFMPVIEKDIIPFIENTLIPDIGKVTETVKGLIQTFMDLPDPVKIGIAAIGGLAAAGGPLLMWAGQMVFAFNNISGALGPLIARRGADAIATQAQAVAYFEAQLAAATLATEQELLFLQFGMGTKAQVANALSTQLMAAAELEAATATRSLGASMTGFLLNPIVIATAAVAGLTFNYLQHTSAVKSHVKALEEEAEAQAKVRLGDKAPAERPSPYIKRAESQSVGEINARIAELRKKSTDELTKFEQYDRASGLFQPIPEGEGSWLFYSGSRSRFAEKAAQLKEDYQKDIAEIAALRSVKSERNKELASIPSAAINFEKEAYGWQMAGLKAEEAGDKQSAAWDKINASYNKGLADTAKKAAEDPNFDKAAADALVLQQYRTEKAQYFRDKQRTLTETATKKAAASSEAHLMALEAEAAQAKASGDDVKAAMLRAQESYDKAIFDANEIDSSTGLKKYSSSVIGSKTAIAAAEFFSAKAEAVKVGAEKVKTAAKEAWAAWGDLTSSVIEGRKLSAEAAGDKLGVGTAEADLAFESGMAAIAQKIIDNGGKSSPAIDQAAKNLIAADKLKRKQLQDAIAKERADAAQSERSAGFQLTAKGLESAAAGIDISGTREGTLDRINAVTTAATDTMLSKQWSAYADYERSRNALLRDSAEKKIDVTNQLALVDEQYRDSYISAVRDRAKAIDDETTRYATNVEKRIQETRREAIEFEKAQRSKSRILSMDDIEKQATLAGINNQFGSDAGDKAFERRMMANSRQTPGTAEEYARAIQQLNAENNAGTQNLAAILQLIHQALQNGFGSPQALPLPR
jgi:hypothetical protein